MNSGVPNDTELISISFWAPGTGNTNPSVDYPPSTETMISPQGGLGKGEDKGKTQNMLFFYFPPELIQE